MKKSVAILLVYLMIFSLFTVSSYGFNDIEEASYKKAISHLSNLNIINGYEDGSFRPEEVLKRGELAVIITKLLNLEEIASGTENKYFTDIPSDHFAKGAISYCVSQGFMSGYGQGIFMPDRPVSYNEALKIIINVLGYKFYAENAGGYPFGYRSEAKRLNLTKGLASKDSDAINRQEVCQIIYNALTIPLLEVSGVGENITLKSDPDVTILSRYFNMVLESGIVNGNGITKIDYVPDCGDDSFVFNNKILNKNGKYNKDYLGRNVEVIYTNENSENPESLVSIVQDDKYSDEITIQVKDIEEINDNEIIYMVNDKEISVKFSASRKIVYNGVFDFTYNLFDVLNINDGCIKLIENNGDKIYDVILIDDSEIFLNMSTIGERLYLRDIEDGSKFLDINNIEYVEIYDAKGNLIDEEQFKSMIVNVASVVRSSDYFARINIVDESITGEITEKGSDNNREYIILGSNKYYLSKEYRTNSGISINSLDKVTAYFDLYGNVCYMVKEHSGGLSLGYLMDLSSTVSYSENMKFKIFTRDNKIKVFDSSDKIYVNKIRYSTNRDIQSIRNTLYVNENKGFSQFICYKLNEEGKLTEIHQYGTEIDSENDKLYKFTPLTSERFSTGSLSFGGVVNVDSKTWILKVPAQNAANSIENDFMIYTPSLFVSDSYTIEYYLTSYQNQVADIVSVLGSVVPPKITYDDYLCILQSKTTALDENGSYRTKLKYYSNKKTYEKFVVENNELNQKINALNRGDVFRFSVDMNNDINGIEHYYNAADDQWVYTAVSGKPQTNDFAATARIARGYVSYMAGGYIRLAYTPALSNAYEAQYLESHKVPGNYIFTVVRKTGNGNVIIDTGSEKDIELLDIIVVRTRGGGGREIIIFKGGI